MKDEPIVSLNGDMFAVRSCTEKHGVWIEKWHPKRKPDALDKLIEAVGADDGSDDEDADDWFFFPGDIIKRLAAELADTECDVEPEEDEDESF